MITGNKGRLVAIRKNKRLFFTSQNTVQPLLIDEVSSIFGPFILIKSDTEHRPSLIKERQIFFAGRPVVRQTVSAFKYFLPNLCCVRDFDRDPILLLMPLDL